MLDAVHDAYVAMAASGRVTDTQCAAFFAADKKLVADLGCQTVMLAGTDLGLAFDGHTRDFRIFDCARPCADAIAAAAQIPA